MQIGTQKLWTKANGHTYQTHCKRGHEFNVENTYISPKSRKRSCRICDRLKDHERHDVDPDMAKAKQREHMREWRRDNPERYKASYLAERKRKRDWMNAQKTKCARCPETDPICLDFHHVDPNVKEADLAKAYQSWSIARINDEIAKCIVLCANCHRKLHASERNKEVSNHA